MALEKGIASLVEAFIAAGRPSSRDQHIDDRRAGYIASAVLAGETETRVRVEDITLEGMHFRVVSPPTADGLLPTLIYYHGGCFVSGGFTTHDNQLWIVLHFRPLFQGIRVPIDYILSAFQQLLLGMPAPVAIIVFALIAWQISSPRTTSLNHQSRTPVMASRRSGSR